MHLKKLNCVIIAIACQNRREVGYEKIKVPFEFLEFHPDFSGTTEQAKFCIGNKDNVWLYAPFPSQTMYADENHPLLQSYVDTVLQGCLEWGGEVRRYKPITLHVSFAPPWLYNINSSPFYPAYGRGIHSNNWCLEHILFE